MIVCKNCGVELDESMEHCPLCGENPESEARAVNDSLRPVHAGPKELLLSDFQGLTAVERRNLFWQLSGIILVSGTAVTFIIDFIINRNITWSRYSMTAAMVLFVNITFLVKFANRTVIALAGNFLFTSFLLVLFDLFNKNIGWGTKLGVPLVLAFFLVVYILISLVRRAKQRGINLIAYFLMALGILCLCIEGIISVQVGNRLVFQWSLIALASVVPVSAILLFIHYRLRKGTDLKRFFHI